MKSNPFIHAFLTLLILLSVKSYSQNENCLDFDGVDDVVTATGASALIANSTSGISLSFWVYAKNTAPGFPDFDGFAGFRNSSNCDFYLLQLTGSTIEGRFRNSFGTNYDVIINGFQTNVWQHLVLTYDGSSLKGYLNGSLAQTTSATGTITSNSTSFLIGNVAFTTANFNTIGKLDEVGVWKRALTAAEINCMYQYGHDASDLDLKLYYKFNQGMAGGSNPSITSIIDETGSLNASPSGFAFSGSTSNFTSGVDLKGHISASICPGDSTLFEGNYLKNAGTYSAMVSTGSGCDSIVILELSIDSVNTKISATSDTTLQADIVGASYQWIDCVTNMPIPGATQRDFVASQNGNYACIITDANCTVTSDCKTIDKISIIENGNQVEFKCFPNPAKDKLNILLDQFEQDVEIRILDLTGKIILTNNYNGVQEIGLNLQISSGVYMLEVKTNKGTSIQKIVVAKL